MRSTPCTCCACSCSAWRWPASPPLPRSRATTTDTTTLGVQNRLPSVSMAADDETPVVGQVVTFTGTVTDADSGSAAPWLDKGYGNGFCDVFSDDTCMTNSFSRTFATPGDYTIKLRGHDSDSGQTDTQRTITVRAAPTAALEPSAAIVVAGEDVTLDASGSTGQDPLTYRWDLDGDAQNGFEVDGGESACRSRTPAGRPRRAAPSS